MRLIRALDLHDHRRQVAVYAQGLGTNGAGRRGLATYRSQLPDPWALRLTPAPVVFRFPPKLGVDRVRGLAFRSNAMTRLDSDLLSEQDIAEVWFTGCHTDIGGGGARSDTAVIALRWMLGEAITVDQPLELNEQGWALLNEQDEVPPVVHQSFNARWRLIEWIPRQEPMNGGLWPKLQRPPTRTGERKPAEVLRDQRVWLHTTAEAGTLSGYGVPIERVPTRRRSGRVPGNVEER